jgi:reverse gyrase
MKCVHCDSEIPQERLDAIENCRECVKCSTVQKMVGFMVFDCKTNGELVMIDPRDKEMLRQARNFNDRSR